MKSKILFFVIFILLIGIVPFSILPHLNILATLKSSVGTANLMQRFSGLFLFVLLFWQITIGNNMSSFSKFFGDWVFKFHAAEGVLIFILLFLHPLDFAIFRHYSGNGFDPFFIYTSFCVYCQTKTDFFYTMGRVSFWLGITAVLAALFRHSGEFMIKNWRKFHTLNYLVFLIVGLHGFLLGSDFSYKPFIYFAIPMYAYILWLTKLGFKNFNSYKLWLKS